MNPPAASSRQFILHYNQTMPVKQSVVLSLSFTDTNHLFLSFLVIINTIFQALKMELYHMTYCKRREFYCTKNAEP